MTMKSDLKDLKRQRRETIKDLHLTYLHTKRDLTRAVNPDRHIRRHLGVALGLAAVVGMILAPAPGPRPAKAVKEQKRRRRKSRHSMLAKIIRPLIVKLVPEAKQFLPDFDKTADVEDYYEDHPNMVGPPPPSHLRREKHSTEHVLKPMLEPLLLQVAMTLMKRFNIQKLVSQLLAQFRGKDPSRDGDDHHEGPHVTMADAGTVPPSTTPSV